MKDNKDIKNKDVIKQLNKHSKMLNDMFFEFADYLDSNGICNSDLISQLSYFADAVQLSILEHNHIVDYRLSSENFIKDKKETLS